jgi:hypothetical protein
MASPLLYRGISPHCLWALPFGPFRRFIVWKDASSFRYLCWVRAGSGKNFRYRSPFWPRCSQTAHWRIDLCFDFFSLSFYLKLHYLYPRTLLPFQTRSTCDFLDLEIASVKSNTGLLVCICVTFAIVFISVAGRP